MKKNGPRDVSYAVLYDKKDADYIASLSPDNLFSLIEKESDVFLQIAKADDIVTYPGLAYCMQLILGTQTTRFSFYGVGSSSIIADPFRQTLVSEASSRMNLTIPAQGSATRTTSGGLSCLRFIGIFPASFQTITVTESGMFTTSTPNTGIMLNRNVFSSAPITHVSGVTAFTVASDVRFGSVIAWG